jgi:hypothetical protein
LVEPFENDISTIIRRVIKSQDRGTGFMILKSHGVGGVIDEFLDELCTQYSVSKFLNREMHVRLNYISVR